MSWVEGLEQRFKAALLEQEQRTLLGLLEAELPSLTFGQLAEFVNSPLGGLLRDVKVLQLVRPPPINPGRPPSSSNPVQAQREAAILRILEESRETLSQVQVGDRLGARLYWRQAQQCPHG
jgi:hypothetical protein